MDRVFSFLLWPKREAHGPRKQGRKKRGSITCPTDGANEANKMFIIWLCWLFRFWNGDRELEVRTATILDPVVRRGDNFIPGINHAIPRINFIPGLNCVAWSGDKFILGINRANPGIKLTQRSSRVKSLSRCFFVMKHYRKQFCRYTCFSNNINISASAMRASFYHKERKI